MDTGGFPRRRVVVTGGAGFLGSHLCARLLADGCEVLCVDNFVTGRREHIAPLLPNPRFEVLRHDVTRPLDGVTGDAIVNLACPASPVHYRHDPVQTTRTCVEGAVHVLELSRRLGIPVLQASTSEVYGDPAVHPQPESYWGNVNPLGPRSCYTEGKRCAETLFFDYRRQHGLPVKVARIFNTYGPRMHPVDGRVVSTFVLQALRGEPLTVHGDGTQTRSFCYVDDLIEGLVRLLGTPDGFTGPVNLGNPEEVTVGDLARRIVRLAGSASPLRFVPRPPDDPARRCPDIALARERLGWEPRVSLDAGLRRTVGWFARLAGRTLPPPRQGVAEGDEHESGDRPQQQG